MTQDDLFRMWLLQSWETAKVHRRMERVLAMEAEGRRHRAELAERRAREEERKPRAWARQRWG